MINLLFIIKIYDWMTVNDIKYFCVKLNVVNNNISENIYCTCTVYFRSKIFLFIHLSKNLYKFLMGNED